MNIPHIGCDISTCFQEGSNACYQSILVLDDYLDPHALFELRHEADESLYRDVGESLCLVDRGPLLAGATTLWPWAQRDKRLASLVSGCRSFIGSSAIDRALVGITERIVALDWFSQQQSDCAGVISSFFKRTRESSQARHHNNDRYICTFMLFLHEKWNGADGGDIEFYQSVNSSSYQGDKIKVLAKPNRLIIIPSGLEMAMSAVQSNNPYLSLSGYFLRRHAADALRDCYIADISVSSSLQ